MITVSGNEQPEEPSDRRGIGRPRGPLLGLIGLLIGLVMGAVFAGGDTEPTVTSGPPPEDVVEPSASPTTTTTRPPPPQRLATRVPGLLDNVVIMAADVVGGESAQLWEPLDIESGPANIPLGDYSGDVSKQWLSAVTTTRYQLDNTLWVGNSRYMEPVALDVEGAVWHARVPARIAYTAGRQRGLWTAQVTSGAATAPRPIPVEDLARDEVPVWYTQTGITLWDPGIERGLRLIDEAGRNVRTIAPARFVAAGRELLAAIVFEDGGPRGVLLDENLNELGEAPWGVDCTQGRFSGSLGVAVALLCDADGERVTSVWGWFDDRFELIVDIASDGLGLPAWTSDGRIVVTYDVDGSRPSTDLIFFDTLTERAYTIQYAARILQIETAVP